ncbi:hypothetical protein BDZ45DRAFT_744980 [Acephala macrosclerotiorum]|nr:hypothetical protein BDZ45DRAFT_744980 [Acephala macrosclerotiorum]
MAQAEGQMVVPASGGPRNATPQPGVIPGQAVAMQQRQHMINAQQIQQQRAQVKALQIALRDSQEVWDLDRTSTAESRYANTKHTHKNAFSANEPARNPQVNAPSQFEGDELVLVLDGEQHDAANLEKLTKDRVVEFYKDFFLPASPLRSKLVI